MLSGNAERSVSKELPKLETFGLHDLRGRGRRADTNLSRPNLTWGMRKSSVFAIGGRSSMVESKLVELVVAGSNPVGHPIPKVSSFEFRVRGSVNQLETRNAKRFRHP